MGAGQTPLKAASLQSMQPMALSAITARGLFLLQVLVELAQERDEDIPALVYEARPAGRASARQRQQPSPAELQGVTVEAPALGSPTEGASSLCWGSVELFEFLCLPRSGNPNTPINPCRKAQATQLSPSTRSTVGAHRWSWGPASHLMQRTGWLTSIH